jgi:FtsH-binding integral membrane protein
MKVQAMPAKPSNESYGETDFSRVGPSHIYLRRNILRVYKYMAGGLTISGVTAAVILYSGFYAAVAGTYLMWALLLAPVPIGLILEFRLERISAGTAQVAYWSYAILLGLSLTILSMLATGANIAEVFFVSAATFLGMSLWGDVSGSDITRLGWFLMMGLSGVVIAALASLLLGSHGLQFAISVMTVVIFTGLMAWWTQRIKGAPGSDLRSEINR